MWSGPRNISTAMMRSFGARADCAVVDEPFYAYYLAATGLDHPMRDAVIESQATDWRRVVDGLLGPVPDDRPVWYQKHMAHHLLPEMGRGWLDLVTNCLLIRDPAEVVASYVRKRESATPADLGYAQQREIFERELARNGAAPPVIDARDVLENPEGVLSALCRAVGIPFDPAMLHWPAGRRATDGVWAVHWYQAVEASTGFQPYRKREVDLPPAYRAVEQACRPDYDMLWAHRLVA